VSAQEGRPAPAVEGFLYNNKPQWVRDDEIALRDWFAGQALAGMIPDHGDVDRESMARHAYLYADAMLKAREAR